MPDNFEIPPCRKCARDLKLIRKRILGVVEGCKLDERFLYVCPVTQGTFGSILGISHDRRIYDQDAKEYPYNENL